MIVAILTGLWRDLVQAGRSLVKARAFTFVCVISLGIGMAPVIGIPYATRIFTTPPLAVDTEDLVEVVTTRVGPRRASDQWSYPDFIDLRDAAAGIAMTAWAMGESDVTLQASGDLKKASPTMFVLDDYFATIGVELARGAGFGDTKEAAVILAYGFWQNRLAADPDIIGKPLTLNGVPHLVAGIAPDSFGGHLGFHDAELFVPLERHPHLLGDETVRFDRGKRWLRIHGRLSPGVGIGQASAAVSAITSQLAAQHPATNEFTAGTVEPYHAMGSLEASDMRIITAVWQTMTLLPLLVVCLNISGMVQVRSAMRERELSIRQAVGASKGRLVQHLLAEAVVLAGLGGALASLVLFNAPSVMSWWLGEPIPLRMQEALRVDLSMIAICVGLCLGTSLLFGWLPAVRFSRPTIITVLKDEAGSGGIRVGRAHRRTAALQIAVAVPLIVLSFISVDRVRATASADLGFEADRLYAAPLRVASVADEDSVSRLRRVRDTLARAGGVAAVTIADGLPLDFRYRIARVSPETDVNVAPRVISAHVTRVGDDYLETLGIPLLRGREFTSDDRGGVEMVTVVSKALADELFPNAAAIGGRLTFAAPGDQTPQRTLTIVGVTADFPTSQMSTERAQLLVPLAQHPDVRRDSVAVEDDRGGVRHVMLVASGAAGASSQQVTAALEHAIREIDPDFDPATIVTGVSLRQNSVSDFLNQSAVAGTVGGILLLLAALGIYGVVGLMVATRTREIAVRVAFGASRRRVVGMILFDVVKLVTPGVAAGVLITVAFVRLNGENMGIPLSNLEPLGYVIGGALATLVAIAASLAPARRAASVQPMVAMRSE